MFFISILLSMNKLVLNQSLKLFCDGSVNPQSKIGYGAYFILEDITEISLSSIQIMTKQFKNTSSTKLELETLLWALGEVSTKYNDITVYTDCQNTMGLLSRRQRLEKDQFYSKSGKLLNNHLLYKEFYKIIDNIDCKFIKVKGHKQSLHKDMIDKLFTLVDKASRDALRNE